MPRAEFDRFGGGGVNVRLDGQFEHFYRTNRGIEDLTYEGGKIVETVLTDPDLAHKTVLDAGCGDGLLTTQLRSRSVDAIGLDIALRPEQKRTSHFIERDIRDTGLPDRSVDLSISAFNVFYYPVQVSLPNFRKEALAELSRITRTGGGILLIALTDLYPMSGRFRSVRHSGVDEINRLLADRPELELIAIEERNEGSTVLLRKREL